MLADAVEHDQRPLQLLTRLAANGNIPSPDPISTWICGWNETAV